ncbi:DUF417 family protein [Campylobacter insulaenigrae]|uniref:Hypothetical membrane protein (DUF417 domain) n=1 Tax=Campylobacter insulaenigrae NCTC 12927 TaxID=1031564 RepID=A0A0A8H2U5_9BACT|nr:DUF417 domain-containing membrane protein [Campylobacter insulaenigrae]AJC88443.1 hypothetical membrane protein (DUF417 domain) [Campylobacter insulaenigrae NCTC 12927]MCR6593875.1 DUF417 domain-containing membrane protein [Campylobacter insulaenigrae]VEH96177.1 Predicted membrane protein [Campylobacter insulaenigrae]
MNKLANYFINTNIDKFVLRFVVILVFLAFGISKWFDFEVELLKPLFSKTWLAFLPHLFGDAGASYALGIVEGIIYICLIIGFFNPKFGVIGALGVLATSLTTLSLMIQLGFDGFLFKDVLFIGASCVILKFDLKRILEK